MPWRELCWLVLFWLFYWDFLSFLSIFFFSWRVGVDSPPISRPCESCQWKLNSVRRRCAAQPTPDQTHDFYSAGPPHTCRAGPSRAGSGWAGGPASPLRLQAPALINLNAY